MSDDHSDDFLERLAAALDVAPLTEAEQTLLLDLARDVAHGTERRYAPLSAFLLGLQLGGSGGARGPALDAVCTEVAALLAT